MYVDFTSNTPYPIVIGTNCDEYTLTYGIDDGITKNVNTHVNRILTFKTSILRDEFLNNFRDLIEIAKPLL